MAALMGLLAVSGCTDGTPTSGNENLIPAAESFELLIPYSEFVGDLQVFGGFASAEALENPPVAHQYRGELEARALVRLASLPAWVPVPPPGGGATQPDSAYTVTGGRIVLWMDTVRLGGVETVEVAAEPMEARWDPETANWTHAVDTLGDRTAWEEPGGGPTLPASVGSWAPFDGDSLFIELDSLTAARLADRESPVSGLRISSRTPGTYLELRSATFRADVRSEINPDTVLRLAASGQERTVIYTPQPGVSTSEIRIGGAPARRAYFTLDPPRTIEGDAAACAVVPCPFDVTPDAVVYAGLVLRTTTTEPSAFQLLSSMGLDARPALAPDRVPRSPLGSPVQPAARTLQPAQFGDEAGARVEIPMTRYIRDLLREPESPDDVVPNTLVLFAASEPSGLPFATFRGPGGEGEPLLRIILTVSEGIRLP
jgi:hypothetical protein